ncbi:MAG: site-2 protease family protein [Chloroflexi bacterium]|nr:site-2 protease family protein [Chloroflexota bacterium]
MNIFPDAVIGFGQFIIAIALLIIIHEFGHFIAANLVKIKIEEFGIGFPPRIKKLFEYKGVAYTLNWIPLGGFVRPKGENDPDVPGGFGAASPWARLFVLISGPAMNLMVGVILFAIIFTRLGEPNFNKVVIVEIDPDSPAEAAGLLPGDIFQYVNDIEITDLNIISETINEHLDESVLLTILRDEESIRINLIPRSNPPADRGAMGVEIGPHIVSVSPVRALSSGTRSVYQYMTALISLPAQLISGDISPEEGRIVGYKGMYDIYSTMRQNDQDAPEYLSGVNTLAFFASVTVSLGLLNLLPIPALDGGRILFTLAEIVLRRRIPVVYENAINLIGFAVLLIALLYFNLNDFLNPIDLPK